MMETLKYLSGNHSHCREEGRAYDHSSIHPIALVFKACVLRA